MKGVIVECLGDLVRGVGKYYKENLKITRLSDDRVEIVFPK
jgi:hypothetical protein